MDNKCSPSSLLRTDNVRGQISEHIVYIYAKRFLAMLKSTCANSISKSILSNFCKTYVLASCEKTWGQNWEYRDEKYCNLVVVFLVSGFDQETKRTQFGPLF